MSVKSRTVLAIVLTLVAVVSSFVFLFSFSTKSHNDQQSARAVPGGLQATIPPVSQVNQTGIQPELTNQMQVNRAKFAPKDGVYFDIPFVSNSITPDLQSTGWDGFRIEVMAGNDLPGDSGGLFQPTCKLAWNEEGLLVSGVVQEEGITLAAAAEDLYRNSSVQIVVADCGNEASNHYVLQLGPGKDAADRGLTYWFKPPVYRVSPEHKPNSRVHLLPNGSGYEFAVVLPWSYLGLSREDLGKVGFQISASHPTRSERFPIEKFWYPSNISWRNPTQVYTLRCTTTASPSVKAILRPRSRTTGRSSLVAIGTADLIGQTAQISRPKTAVPPTVSTFQNAGRNAIALFTLDSAALDTKQRKRLDFVLTVNNSVVSYLPEEFSATVENKSLGELHIGGKLIFAEDHFPDLVCLSADNIPLPANKVEAVFFNKDHMVAKAPTEPGRYGAMATISLQDGTQVRRFATLFKVPKRFLKNETGEIALDQLFSETSNSIQPSKFIRSKDFIPALDTQHLNLEDPIFAACAAAAFDPLVGAEREEPWLQNQEWWIIQRRRISGVDVKIEERPPSILPRPATTLHEGAAEEAGVDSAVVNQIDNLCSMGCKEFPEEPLSFCFARRGTVFYHKSFGQLSDASPNSVAVPTQLTSAGKVLTGLVWAVLNERASLNINSPISDLHRRFPKQSGAGTATLRQLFNHTSGLENSLDTYMSLHDLDIEELICEVLPPNAQKRVKYSSSGYRLIGSIFEDLTEQPMAELYRKLIFSPLGIGEAEQIRANGSGFLTVWETAVVGQLLLNKGSYGNVRLFSEETYMSMLPQLEGGPRSGIGLESVWDTKIKGYDPLPNDAYGHTTGHSGMFIVVPQKELIIVIGAQRFGPRAFSDKYGNRLIELLLSACK